MYSSALDGVVEGLALDGGNLELLGGGLAGAVAGGEGAGTPGRAAVDLAQVGQLTEAFGVTQRDKLDAVVGKSRHGGESG